MDNYYDVLGIDRTATQDEIKRAYRQLAHKYHPDKSGGDEERFKQVNAAYQVLSDEQKRTQYDQFGQTFDGSAGPGAGPFGGQGVNVNFEDLGGFGDIFEQFFGGRARSATSARQRGSDISIDVTISFIESATATTKEVSHRLHQVCSRCKGNQAEPGTPIKECPTCQGTGSVSRQHQTPLGVFAQTTVCPTCHGEGKQAETPCTQCHGEGREMTNRTLSIDIPAGIADGQTIRITGKGEVPAGSGTPGDLYVTIHVAPHQELIRDADNIRTTITIPLTDAALGTEIEIPTLTNPEYLAIPAGTQPGTEFTLRGQGFPHLQTSGRGDLIATVNVEVPTKLSRKQRHLLEEFRTTKPKRRLFS